jgi:hypothetical protein
MKAEYTTRFSGIFDASTWPVTLIGAGGIGAFTAMLLAKMGIPALTLVDGDHVSEENIGTQFHRASDVGLAKVFALAEAIKAYGFDTSVQAEVDRITRDTNFREYTSPIIISAVDSITARQEIWASVSQVPWMYYLDARMGAEVMVLYTVKASDPAWYNATLARQDESAVPDLPCTSKATIYGGAVAASYVAATVRKIVTGLPVPRIVSLDLINNVMHVVE